MNHERNAYIDMLKGIAALGIISIHTAFWSGESYTPVWFRSLTLMLDVPFFFFLSGWGSSYRDSNVCKAAKSLGKIWLKWIYFASVLTVFCFIAQYLPAGFCAWGGVVSVRELIRSYMFQPSFPGFSVVSGSLWFIPYYFIAVLLNTAVLAGRKDDAAFKKFYCILLAVLFLWVSYGNYFFNIDSYVLFYGFFWMLGQVKAEIKIGTLPRLAGLLLVSAGGYIFSSYLLEIPLTDMQSAKFPPSIMYAFSSFMVIIIAVYLEPYMKKYNRWLVHIGQNAIFYFFGQGIGSSVIYGIVTKLSFSNWIVKWMAAYICNVLITSIAAEGLAFLYARLQCLKARHDGECSL